MNYHQIKLLRPVLLWTFLATLFLSTGCSNNDFPNVDGKNPIVTLSTDHIQTELGRQFTVAGKVTDNDGLRSIRLQNSDLSLDKTIDLLDIYGKPVNSYDLSYNYVTATSLTGNSFPIKVTATDVGGRTTDATLSVTMDGDFTAPTFVTVPDTAITVLIKSQTVLKVHFTADDNKALNYVKIVIPDLNISDSIPAGGVKELETIKSYTLPSTAAKYKMTITAADKFANKVIRNSTVSVSQMPDFAKMYLTDVTDVKQLTSDLFGVPMLMEHTGAYQYRARYYAETANAKIRFIPQKTDFSPICFGINPDNGNTLTDVPEYSQPIVLPSKGYYVITFNTQTGAYGVDSYVPTDTPVQIGSPLNLNGSNANDGTIPLQLSLAGIGLPGASNWSPSNPFVLTQDTDNKFLFYGQMDLTAGTKIQFTITPKHSWGWWMQPFWRFEDGDTDSGENEFNTLNGGHNMTTVTVTKSGKYMFKFDTHLLRSRLYPIQ
jgi:hypothetical protein